jgi:D-tyrosyl-tRNA(Tyr) deacylase
MRYFVTAPLHNYTVNSEVVSSIKRGIVILIGIAADDTNDDLEYIVRRVLNVRTFDDETGTRMWSRSVMDCGYDVLCGEPHCVSERL